MAVLTANDFSLQMVAQLRILDPSVSAEVGTPERKIIDTVVQALADNQVDLTGLSGALDLDSKFGSNLDQFVNLFGFARQVSTTASGYVVFSRNTPAPADITIPVGATIQANTPTANGQFLQYTTTTSGVIASGATDSSSIPVQCTLSGSSGDSAVNTLTNLVGVPLVSGVTSVTNPSPISGGNNQETDNALKVRFQNTVFRNLAGTLDQYLALAVSTAFTTKANVIGPVSTYQEYAQVPDFDDAGYVNGSLTGTPAGGGQGQWTTAVSSIPYAQDIYSELTPYVSNGLTAGEYFYRPGVDFQFNYPPLLVGDAERDSNVAGVTPNFTFLNVYNPSSGTIIGGLQALQPSDILLTEFSYLSTASRNSIEHNVMNAVDIYVDGTNPTQTSSIFLPGNAMFIGEPTDVLYYENYRRDGEPMVRPHPGNFYTPLFQSPITSVPDTITIGTTNYYLGWHYWLVHEVDTLGGSIRARDGIEWSNIVGGDIGNQTPPGNPLAPYAPTGLTINTLASGTAVEIDNFEYDANITVLQSTMEAARQITTDTLVHQARTRYFKIDVTVMYLPNANPSVVDISIGAALQAFMSNQVFGTVVQLSDLLDVVHQVPGVDNVRWSNDLPSMPNSIRVVETDINGNPLHTPWVDRIIPGGSTNEVQRVYFPGVFYGNSNPQFTGVDFNFQITDPDTPFTHATLPITYNNITDSSLSTLVTYLTAPPLYQDITLAHDRYPPFPFTSARDALLMFDMTYNQTTGAPYLPTVINFNPTSSPWTYDSDIFLLDDELPAIPQTAAAGDTVPGAIIRPRAQNTFVRPGIG